MATERVMPGTDEKQEVEPLEEHQSKRRKEGNVGVICGDEQNSVLSMLNVFVF